MTSAAATALAAIKGSQEAQADPRQRQYLAKRFATLQARAALAGVTLAAIEDDAGRPAYVVSRWALTRQLGDLDAVERWLDLVTGAAAGAAR